MFFISENASGGIVCFFWQSNVCEFFQFFWAFLPNQLLNFLISNCIFFWSRWLLIRVHFVYPMAPQGYPLSYSFLPFSLHHFQKKTQHQIWFFSVDFFKKTRKITALVFVTNTNHDQFFENYIVQSPDIFLKSKFLNFFCGFATIKDRFFFAQHWFPFHDSVSFFICCFWCGKEHRHVFVCLLWLVFAYLVVLDAQMIMVSKITHFLVNQYFFSHVNHNSLVKLQKTCLPSSCLPCERDFLFGVRNKELNGSIRKGGAMIF